MPNAAGDSSPATGRPEHKYLKAPQQHLRDGVMNNCPPARSWVHLQKGHYPFLDSRFEGTAQLLPGESIKQRMKNSGSISHCQEAEAQPHQAVAWTHTQDQNVD
ncbi:hypothetical protein EYF80_030032 [Liparis tanakae]|uniref:Uncharacterized protein n=1 Tax=Liparis tanakae TaxID=230148 RepID=A0A4Z2H1W2_9TELE|nr:hypothetical protein EYF80_030032 [Liparis tanakae]